MVALTSHSIVEGKGIFNSILENHCSCEEFLVILVSLREDKNRNFKLQ